MFSDSEPLNESTQSIPCAHLPTQPKKLSWPAQGRANIAIVTGDEVTNLTDSLIYLPKCYNFDKHALISKDIVNAHT